MKKLLAMLIICLICFSSVCALEVSDEDFDLWYEEMVYLSDEIGSRMLGQEGHEQACDYLYSRFEEMGYSEDEGTLLASVCTAPSYGKDEPTECVSWVAVKPALSENPKIVTLCAHYDGYDAGARDNASGAAAVLALANLYAQKEPFEDVELRFIVFGVEEICHESSLTYCDLLTEDERNRCIATFNIDILVADVWEERVVFSLDTMGMRTADGYVSGTEEAPAINLAVQTLLEAMEDVGAFPADEVDVTWCAPLHRGDSDHESFHLYGMDAVNVCFHGTAASGSAWPIYMHTERDVVADTMDTNRSWDALNALYTAVEMLGNP